MGAAFSLDPDSSASGAISPIFVALILFQPFVLSVLALSLVSSAHAGYRLAP